MKTQLSFLKKTLIPKALFGLILFVPVGLFAQCPDAGDSPNPPNCAGDMYDDGWYQNNCNCSGPFAFQDHDAPTLWIDNDVTLEWYDDYYNLYDYCYQDDGYNYGNYHWLLCDLPSPGFQVSDCCTDHYNLLYNMNISDCVDYQNCDPWVAVVTRTFVAIDDCGNTSTKTQKFYFEDTTAPTLHEYNTYHYLDCDDDIYYVGYPYAYDNCDDYVPVVLYDVITHKGPCPYTFDLERIFTGTDDCGNVGYYTQWIHVEDEDGPYFDTYPLNIVVSCDAVPDPPVVTAWDDCSGPVDQDDIYYSETIYWGSCSNEYQILRTWTTHDDCGNYSYLNHTINVTDNTAPELAGVWDLYQECDDPLPADNMTATDNCDDEVEITGGIWYLYDDDPCETVWYREWYAYDNCGNYDYQHQYLTQMDLTPPIVTADEEVIVPKGGEVPPHGQYTAWDNCTPYYDIIVYESDDVVQELNCLQSVITRTFTAIDYCGNTSSFVQTIYLTADDFEAPHAYCHDLTVTLDSLGNGGVVGQDDLDNGSTDNCQIANYEGEFTFDCSNVGVNYVTLTVIDVAGNTDQCTSTVTVVDNRPMVDCQDITLELEDGIAFLNFPDIISHQEDDCGIVKFLTTVSQYNFTSPGTYPVTLTIYDVNGNSDICISNVTVVDDVLGVPPGCNPENFATVPTGCFSSVFDDNVTLNWDAYTNGMACQLMGNKVSAVDDVSIIVGTLNDPDCPDTKVIPMTNLEPSTVYRWKVRCGCQANPLVASPFTDYAYFQTPAEAPGVNGNGEEGFGILKDLGSETNELNIYPNPNNGAFTLAIDLDEYNIEIYDLTGKLVWGQYGARDQLLFVELSDLDAGLYHVSVFNEETILTEKIIIQD